MNCKPGDLAVIVSGYKPFVGRIVTVKTKCEVFVNHWDTEPPLLMPGYLRPTSIGDETLRPIRDNPGNESFVTEARKSLRTARENAALKKVPA